VAENQNGVAASRPAEFITALAGRVVNYSLPRRILTLAQVIVK
jgi:hypothetical protein